MTLETQTPPPTPQKHRVKKQASYKIWQDQIQICSSSNRWVTEKKIFISAARRLISTLKALYTSYAQQDCFDRWHPKECREGRLEDLARKQYYQIKWRYLSWDWERKEGRRSASPYNASTNTSLKSKDSSSKYFSFLHLVTNILLPHLSQVSSWREGTQLQQRITAAGCLQNAPLHLTSERPSTHLQGTPRTITPSKKPKHITCKYTLSVALRAFRIPPEHYLHIEFKTPLLRALGLNGVRHKPSCAPCFPQPDLTPLTDNSVSALSLCSLKRLSEISSTGEFKREFRPLSRHTTHWNHHLLIRHWRILPGISHVRSCPVIICHTF